MADLLMKAGGKMVGKKVGKKTLGEQVNMESVYYDRVPVTRLGVKTTKKVKKAHPPGLTDQEKAILTKVKKRAYSLDLALINCCGIRFGWSAVIGIIPAVGDVADLLMAYSVMRLCMKADLPADIISRMTMNLVIDFLIGIVPILGDIADGVYKANTRNAALLEKVLRKRGQERLDAAGGQRSGANHRGDHRGNDRGNNRGARVEEDSHDSLSDEEVLNQQRGGPPPRYSSTKRTRQQPEQPREPQPARVREPRSWTSYFGGRKEVDVEAGEAAPPQQPPRPDRTRTERSRRER